MVQLKMHDLYNPFDKIGGLTSLILGFLAMAIAAAIASVNGTHYPDLIAVQYSTSTGWHVPFFEVFFGWVVLAFFGVVFCKLLGTKNLRIIDVVGAVALSRAPYILVSLAGFWENLGLKGILMKVIIYPFLVVGVAWSLVLLFYGLKVSANLKEKTQWLAFLATFVLGMVISALSSDELYLLIL